MQFILKVVLNPRPNEVAFYNIVLHITHDILARGIDKDDAQMEMDKEDLEEAKAAMAFAEKTRVFDQAPPEILEPSIP